MTPRAGWIGLLLLLSVEAAWAGGSDTGDMPQPPPQEPVTLRNPVTGEPITLTPEIPKYGNYGSGTPTDPLRGGLVSSPPIIVSPPPSTGDPPVQPPPPPPPPQTPPPTSGPGDGNLLPPIQPITDPGGPLQGRVGTQPPLQGGVSITVPGTGRMLTGGISFDDPVIQPIVGHGTPGAAPELQFWEGVTAGAKKVYEDEWVNLPANAVQKMLQKFGPGWLQLLLNGKDLLDKINKIKELIEKSGPPVDGMTYETGFRLGEQMADLVNLTGAGELAIGE